MFQFKQFSVEQDRCAMKIGTDAVLLGAWTPIPKDIFSVLDIGSGTGHHVKNLSDNGYKAIGIDTSPAMIKKAKKIYPDMDYQNVDALSVISFPQNSFSQITCLYFTIYYIKDKQQFFNNCIHWLKPGGFFITEHHEKQGELIRSALAKDYLPAQTHADLTGRDRFTSAVKR